MAVWIILAACADPWQSGVYGGQATPSVSTSVAPTLSTAVCKSVDGLPDTSCTPGVVDPHPTLADLCRGGWSKAHRPPTSYTNPLKLKLIKKYGNYAGSSPANYELDHLIPISWGGSPTDPRNLWPESPPSTNPKDKLEIEALPLICHGKISLDDAQRSIATDWKALAHRLNIQI